LFDTFLFLVSFSRLHYGNTANFKLAQLLFPTETTKSEKR